jgi:hypothetical protein
VAAKGASGRRAFRPRHAAPNLSDAEKVDGGFHFLTGPAGHPGRILGRTAAGPYSFEYGTPSAAGGIERPTSPATAISVTT